MIRLLKRIVYFGYYVKNLDWRSFISFLDHSVKESKKNRFYFYAAIFYNSLKYNISILEYFQFDFLNKSHTEKSTWAGTGFMYEFQLIMNPIGYRSVLDDKRLFADEYEEFLVHNVVSTERLQSQKGLFENKLKGKGDKVVLKYADGKCGVGVEVCDIRDFGVEELVDYMKQNNFDLVENYIVQHIDLNRLSPSAVNTVRIFTQLNVNDEVEILGCRQRISVNNSVDNLAAGNIVAAIDEKTGRIYTKGFYSDITKLPVEKHPVTGVELIGFQVPLWTECLTLVKKAALHNKSNRSIGWDVVVTNEAVGLIEGNHDWCKLVWQLPVEKGLRNKLLKYS